MNLQINKMNKPQISQENKLRIITAMQMFKENQKTFAGIPCKDISFIENNPKKITYTELNPIPITQCN